MKDWKITYSIKDGDGETCSVWETAETAEQAEQQARQEYWDIDNVIQVVPM